MGVLIPGIDMPDSCDNCFICNRCEGNCDISDADYLPNKRPDDCPLIELPPHGRLINAADLREGILSIVFQRSDDPKKVTINANTLLKLIDSLHTIIPADGGADG